MSEPILVALIAAAPPSAAAILGYLATRRSLERSVGKGEPPLADSVARFEARTDERFDRLERRIERVDERLDGLNDRQARLQDEVAARRGTASG